ncbi:MAG TPA: radical SAM protein [Spirochaetota bacterium]|nr:radical SAM protein [Spirochaetota bacterium]HPI91170.1 radical SAM protein [Spirochaetota bacterium]HPR46918.1 radical SAM protein [Spirochaetota bacterium]
MTCSLEQKAAKNPMNILDLQPFEISFIRPPTENYSLAFRLTRNCYWNKCAFCPVYKTGERFSRRTIDEVKNDIDHARVIDDFLFERGFGIPVYSESDFSRAGALIEEIQRARWEAGYLDHGDDEEQDGPSDPRLDWFRPWFKKKAGMRDCINHLISWRIGGAKTCFFGDADSLILRPDFLAQAIGAARRAFPSLERFTVYGRTSTAARQRTVKELRQFAKAGLDRVHFGLESGSDAVLALVDKGVTATEHLRGCLKIKEAGLSCSVYVMPGLGGAGLSVENAEQTARVINEIGPDFVRVRSLEVFPGSLLEQKRDRGEFIEAAEPAVVREIRTLVEQIAAPVTLISDSASNLLSVSGRLPDDRNGMLAEIDAFLSLSPREQIEFSLRSRLQSFYGQYGYISQDIIRELEPHIDQGNIIFSSLDDSVMLHIIALIRSKLMP